MSQTCCPFNIKFARELQGPAFAAREVRAEKDARALARELLQMSPDEFNRAFKDSLVKRAKLRGLKRGAAADNLVFSRSPWPRVVPSRSLAPASSAG